MAPTKKSKSVAKVSDEPTDLGSVMYDPEDIGAGVDELGSEDLAIPFIGILQKLSPQLDEDESLKAGHIFNNVTMETYDGSEGIVVVPVHRTHVYNEWVPRDAGGGLVRTHEPTDPVVIDARETQAFGDYTTPEGNELVETFNAYCLLLNNDGTWEQVIIPFTSSLIREFKRWMTKIRSAVVVQSDGRRVTPPMFAHRFRIRTRLTSNARGSWYIYDIRWDGSGAADARISPDSDLYQAAKAFRDLVVDGLVAYKMPSDTIVEASGIVSEEAPI